MKKYDFSKLPEILIPATAIILIFRISDNLGYILRLVQGFVKIFCPVVTAFVIAFLTYPLCNGAEGLLCSHPLPFVKKRERGTAVILVYIIILLCLGLLMFIVLPPILKAIGEFGEKIPFFIAELLKKVNASPYFRTDPEKLRSLGERFIDESILPRLNIYASGIMQISGRAVNLVFSLIASAYILTDRRSLKRWGNWALHFFAGKKRSITAKKYIRSFADITYKYLFCVIIDAGIVLVISLIILSIMKLPYSIVLSLILGISNIIPYFGSICGWLIAVVVTLISGSPMKAVALGLILFVMQQIDANLIQPCLIKDSLSVKPFWVLVGVLIGGGLFGIGGIIASVPVIAFVRKIFVDCYEEFR